MRTFLAFVFGVATLLGAETVAGEWTFTMSGPMGEVPAALTLKQDGKTVTGDFDFNGRKLTITEGEFAEGKLKITVKRDRRDGGSAVYRMTATLEGDKLTGSTVTDFMGQESRAPWMAKRKQ